MMDVKTYIQMILKKKKLTYEEFCNRINIVKRYIGDSGKFRRPNLAEIFNTDRAIEERTLLIFEAALELPIDTLTKYSSGSIAKCTKKGNKELREVIKNGKFDF